ncbi:MAG: hypothetical protein QOF48_3199 [Verrucomicrobiota bacterium]|jgi:hypothetical protein
MKICTVLLPLTAFLISGCSKTTPVGITGRVTLQGAPPPEIAIKMGPDCEQLQTNQLTTRHYVVGPNAGLANVLVVIRNEFDARLFPVPTNRARMETVACEIYPYVIAVRTGQPIAFENDSRMMENFHFTPKRNSGRNFVGLRGTTNMVHFDTPEDFIPVKCDVHPWMFGYICAVGHPFFALTQPDGAFTLPAGLRDGLYTLEAVHMKAGAQKKEIKVRNGHSEPIEFAFSVPTKLPKRSAPPLQTIPSPP